MIKVARVRHIPPPTPPAIAAVLSEHDSTSVLVNNVANG